MKKASTVKSNGTRVTRIGEYGEIGLAYEMDDGTLYKTSGCWAEETEAEKVIRDGGKHYREQVGGMSTPINW